MNSIFSNLENGNLVDAKEKAKRYSVTKLLEFAVTEKGMPILPATSSALYLKGLLPWEQYCQNLLGDHSKT